MARIRLDDVLAHWFKAIADFETPTLEFYEQVEEAVERRQMPGVEFYRVDYTEGGALTANREYLRVTRDRLRFDVCAAPFGNGFFFSWWLTERRHKYAVLLAPFILVALWGVWMVPPLSIILDPIWYPLYRHANDIAYFLRLGTPVLLALALFLVLGRVGGLFLRDMVLGTPGLGWLYERLFGRMTYYRLDTIQAFQAGVRGAVEETLQATFAAKGLRALTDEDTRPILRNFLQR